MFSSFARYSRFVAPAACVASAIPALKPRRRTLCDEGAPARNHNSSILSRVLGNSDTAISNFAHALRPGTVTKRRTPHSTEVIRIVLTGGPCAGKSSALDHIMKAATDAGYDVYVAPEIATILLTSGACKLPSANDRNYLFAFQQAIMYLQLQTERSFTQVAAATGRPSIIIFDRGLLDTKAYLSDEFWKDLLNSTEASAQAPNAVLSTPRKLITEEYMLARYNMIIHLKTAADGAVEHYKWGKTTDDSGRVVIRGEPPEVAVSLDNKLRAAYQNHEHHLIIDNESDGFTAKMERASTAVLECAMRIHPQPAFTRAQKRIEELEAENERLKAEMDRLKPA